MDIYLELQESRRSDRAFAWYIPLSEKKLNIKRGLDEIRRGDLLYYETENGGIEKLIFDGKRGYKMIYGRIPSTFQVITEFPPTYWKDRLDNRVPFDFAANVDELKEDEISVSNGMPYFELESDDKVVYTFTVQSKMTVHEFRDGLCQSTYFRTDASGLILYLE